MQNQIPKEYNKRINEVVNYIIKHFKEELSLETLAAIASYSPFHFQKIFKQVVGESPKQYIIRLRLETAAHLLVMQRYKSVTEIAIDCGFSSSATFARAFKNYFGIAADELRNIPMQERLKLYKKSNKQSMLLETDNHVNYFRKKFPKKRLVVEFHSKRAISFHGVFINATLSNPKTIEAAFNKVTQLADTHDLIRGLPKYIGIVYPHQNLYRAVIVIDNSKTYTKNIATIEIQGGKFVTFQFKGDITETFHVLKDLNEKWLPENNYRIADIFCYEILSANPAITTYQKAEREIFIPIEPA